MSDSDDVTNAQQSQPDSPKKKKQRRVCSFSDVWKKNYSFIKSVPNNNYKAHCTLCQRDFSITHGGKNDIEKHQNSNEHKKGREMQV